MQFKNVVRLIMKLQSWERVGRAAGEALRFCRCCCRLLIKLQSRPIRKKRRRRRIKTYNWSKTWLRSWMMSLSLCHAFQPIRYQNHSTKMKYCMQRFVEQKINIFQSFDIRSFTRVRECRYYFLLLRIPVSRGTHCRRLRCIVSKYYIRTR